MAPVLRGARWAGGKALRGGAIGAGWARERGGELLDRGLERGGELIDRIPADEIEEHVRETVSEARDRIDGYVRSELADLRKALRRQRKRLGV
ncbi:MAG: hypothetical protein JWL60_1170 [Gemmatimonadetes bacterium]|nr:hypothetical protein [Gemmatimonadota bacterium]